MKWFYLKCYYKYVVIFVGLVIYMGGIWYFKIDIKGLLYMYMCYELYWVNEDL